VKGQTTTIVRRFYPRGSAIEYGMSITHTDHSDQCTKYLPVSVSGVPSLSKFKVGPGLSGFWSLANTILIYPSLHRLSTSSFMHRLSTSSFMQAGSSPGQSVGF